MQQSTLKEGENKATRDKGQRAMAPSPINWSNKRVKRGCDDSTTIGVDIIAPKTNVTVNKTQQSTNRNAPFWFTQSSSGSGKARQNLVYERRYDGLRVHPKKNNLIEKMVSGTTVNLWICDNFSPFVLCCCSVINILMQVVIAAWKSLICERRYYGSWVHSKNNNLIEKSEAFDSINT